MKLMSTFLAISMLLCATAPAMARNHYYVRSNVANSARFRNPAAANFNQQRAQNYVYQQQAAANAELAREQMQQMNGWNNVYGNPYMNPYNNSYYYGNRRSSILNSIFR